MLDDVQRVGVLAEEQSVRTVLDGDAEEVMKRLEVLHSKLPLQGSDGTAQKLRTGCGQNNIINIKEQIYHVWAATENEERRVRFCFNEPQGSQVCGELAIPGPRSLLQSV
jgi:uncharacterized protein YqgV (UPF0045/DUF77 family)